MFSDKTILKENLFGQTHEMCEFVYKPTSAFECSNNIDISEHFVIKINNFDENIKCIYSPAFVYDVEQLDKLLFSVTIKKCTKFSVQKCDGVNVSYELDCSLDMETCKKDIVKQFLQSIKTQKQYGEFCIKNENSACDMTLYI